MTDAAKDFQISRNGLAKICDRLLVPYPGRGYWSRRNPRKAETRPALPPAPAGGHLVAIAAGRAKSRRPRERMKPEERATQLISAAAQIIAKDGLAAATMRRVARDVGVSEALAHNYFKRRDDLFIALARRELAAMDAARLSDAGRGQNDSERVVLSTLSYLRQVNDRGALIQTLLNSPHVRAGLRSEREARATSARRDVTERINTRYGVPRGTAYGATVILTAICLRAGRLLAERKIPLEMAERLSLAIVVAGNRDVANIGRRR